LFFTHFLKLDCVNYHTDVAKDFYTDKNTIINFNRFFFLVIFRYSIRLLVLDFISLNFLQIPFPISDLLPVFMPLVVFFTSFIIIFPFPDFPTTKRAAKIISICIAWMCNKKDAASFALFHTYPNRWIGINDLT